MTNDWLQTLFPDNAERTLPWPTDLKNAVGETATLYRPTGLQELELVRASGFRRWPTRLPDQPIFYPVPNFDRADSFGRRKSPTIGTTLSAVIRLWD